MYLAMPTSSPDSRGPLDTRPLSGRPIAIGSPASQVDDKDSKHSVAIISTDHNVSSYVSDGQDFQDYRLYKQNSKSAKLSHSVKGDTGVADSSRITVKTDSNNMLRSTFKMD